MRDLSVIVATRNRQELLPPLLASLAAQTHAADRWEVIIVDDGSVDGARDWLASGAGPRPLRTTHVHQAQGGRAEALNTGARMAAGRVLLFLDDDVVAAPTLVAEHVAAHRADPDAVVIGHVSAEPAPGSPWMAWEDLQARKHYARLNSGARPGPRDFYTGNNSVGSGLFHAIGGFSAASQQSVDRDLAYRLAEAGANFHYCPAAGCTRIARDSFADWLREARTDGRADACLAWDEGRAELRGDIFHWFHQRRRANRLVVRLCSAAPALESPAIGLLHTAGLLAARGGRATWATPIYSAIYNLAYWQALSASLGRAQFWEGVAQAGAAPAPPWTAEAGGIQPTAGL
jgi:glycosyltransferase involved in cell wall biosynthesis